MRDASTDAANVNVNVGDAATAVSVDNAVVSSRSDTDAALPAHAAATPATFTAVTR